MRQPHSHACPIHGERRPCSDAQCLLPYVAVCTSEHPRDMLQRYVDRVRKEHNAEIRELERDTAAAYQEGRWDEREESDGRL